MTRLRDVVDTQRQYYDLRAPDFLDVSKPDRRVSGFMAPARVQALVDGFDVDGDVLELACGEGAFTRELVRHARSVTAVDGSPAMLERNRAVLGDAVAYVLADLFAWEPERRYDVVFFANWLSHVPPPLFASFWGLVERCLAPAGRVCFVDEDDRASDFDRTHTEDGIPLATRTLADGREFDVVKVFWRPVDLEVQLCELGWDATVRRFDDTFLRGTVTRA